MPAQRAEIIPGSAWRQVTLGSEAIYEVVAVDGDHVDVSVNSAPGLTPGMRVRLTMQAVRAMVRVDDVDDGDGGLLRDRTAAHDPGFRAASDDNNSPSSSA